MILEKINNGDLQNIVRQKINNSFDKVNSSYQKEEVLSLTTKTLYGLGSNAVPDDVLLKLAALLSKNSEWNKLASYEVAGAYTWTAPDLFLGQDYWIGCLVIGAGESGFANGRNGTGAQGGTSGFSISFTKKISPNSKHNIIVGAKGGSVKVNGSGTMTSGVAGGTSSLDGVTAKGGGTFSGISIGGQVPADVDTYKLYKDFNPFGGIFDPETNVREKSSPNSCYNPFENTNILGAGGNAIASSSYGAFAGGGKSPVDGKGGGHGIKDESELTIVAESASAPGCGGGGAQTVSFSGTAISGAGADGAVYIYIRGATV